MMRKRGSVPIAESMSAKRTICSESCFCFDAAGTTRHPRVRLFSYFYNNRSMEKVKKQMELCVVPVFICRSLTLSVLRRQRVTQNRDRERAAGNR
jgi:hypothetical protein